MSLYKEMKKASRNASSEDGNWLFGVPAIVADNNDPENQHRIRVIIPSIDEDLIFDEWARQFVFCLGDGFGSAFIPPKGAEVVLFGQLGQKYNLFYASLYNEENFISSELSKDVSGFHVPKDLKIIADNNSQFLAQNIEINAQSKAEIKGENVKVQSAEKTEILSNEITLNADGSITIKSGGNLKIEGNNVNIDGNSVKIQGRIVAKNGQPI